MAAPSHELQSALRQLALVQTEVGEVRRIADDRLKPSVTIQDLADRWLAVFDYVEGDH